MKAYKQCCMTEKGAMWICIYRGKLSEGMDFKGRLARAVICVGIPNLNHTSLNVQLKKEYCERKKYGSGWSWYDGQAMNAVNQSLGRLIRSKNDYGGIFLLDVRMT